MTTAGTPRPLSKILDAEAVLRIRELVREVPVATHVKDYAIRLAMATRPGTPVSTELATRFVRYGSSPRGPQSLVLAAKARALFEGRMHASFEDVTAVSRQALRHRVLLNFEGEAEGISPEQIVDDILKRVEPGAG
jgi:MoxR-like ATPase